MLDGILLESRGIPSVVIITDGFIPTAKGITHLWGVPSYEFLTMPHPLSSLDNEKINQQAETLLQPVLDHLVQST